MPKMKNSAAATAEQKDLNFKSQYTRPAINSQGVCQDSQHIPTRPLNSQKLLLVLLFSATVFDELGGGKRYCQRKRALTLGLCQRAQRKLLLLFCSETRRSGNWLQKQQQLLLLLFCGELGRIGGVATC